MNILGMICLLYFKQFFMGEDMGYVLGLRILQTW